VRTYKDQFRDPIFRTNVRDIHHRPVLIPTLIDRRPAQLGDGPRNLVTPGNTELDKTSGARNFLPLTSCCLCLWRWSRRPAQRVSFIFGDGQRTLRRPLRPRPRPRIFYLWRRPAHLATARAPGDGPRNLLTPGNTELDKTSGARNFLSLTSCYLCLWRWPAQPGDGPLNAYLLSLATASAPGDGRCDCDRDRVSFIFGDGQRTWR